MVLSMHQLFFTRVGNLSQRYHSLLTQTTGLLETVLFANIRFHDTVSRGRLLNRFGKDFEGMTVDHALNVYLIRLSPGIDSSMSDNFGRSIVYGLAALTIIITISVVGGPPFVIAALVLSFLYYNGKDCRCS